MTRHCASATTAAIHTNLQSNGGLLSTFEAMRDTARDGQIVFVKLDFLDKVLASVSGHYGSICGTSVIIRSLTFWSNSSMYGPFSTKDGTLFLLPVHFSTPMSSPTSHLSLPSPQSRNGAYGFIGGDARPDMVLLVQGRGDSYAVYTSNHPKQQYTNTSPDYNDGALWIKIVSVPSYYGDAGAAAMSTSLRPMAPRVLYDRNGHAVWGNKHGFSGGVIPDKIEYHRSGHSIWSSRHGNNGHITHRVKLDFPHEVLTCVYYYYSTSREGDPRVLRSLMFVTNRGKYGSFGDEFDIYFSSATRRARRRNKAKQANYKNKLLLEQEKQRSQLQELGEKTNERRTNYRGRWAGIAAEASDFTSIPIPLPSL
uniref:Jacalin-type lectin domain-containing protein n=1 Tax=Zea mays TaxID=4577 RepID=A0A804UHJ2_MAIZE